MLRERDDHPTLEVGIHARHSTRRRFQPPPEECRGRNIAALLPAILWRSKVRYVLAGNFVCRIQAQSGAELRERVVQFPFLLQGQSEVQMRLQIIVPEGKCAGEMSRRLRGFALAKQWKDRVRAKTPRTDGRSLLTIVTGVNRILRGGYEYFQHSQANVFPAGDGYVRRRLRSLQEKRRGRTRQGLGAAHQRWPNEWFARRGLLSLKAEPEWTRTIVAIRTH